MKLGPFHACYTVLRSLYLAAPMRQMVVPQSGHLPFVMGLPFFVVPSTGSCMTFFALHFTQYASIAMVASKHSTKCRRNSQTKRHPCGKCHHNVFAKFNLSQNPINTGFIRMKKAASFFTDAAFA